MADPQVITVQVPAPVSTVTVTSGVAAALASDGVIKLSGMNNPHGWPVKASGARYVTLSYSPSTRKVTITATSGSTFDVWVLGVKKQFNSPYVTDAHDPTEGQWFLSHNGTAFVWSQTAFDLYSVAPVAEVYWSSLLGSGVAWNELHGNERDVGNHVNLHNTRGTVLASGGVLYGYTPDTDADAALKFDTSTCVIYDEDLPAVLDAKPGSENYTIFRRSGTSGYWTWTTASALPFFYGTYPQRNYDAGGGTGWTLADIGSDKFVTYYLFAIPALDSAFRFVLIPGSVEYSTLATAQSELPSALGITTLPFVEMVAIAQLVFKANSGYSGTAKAQLSSVVRLTGSLGSISGASASGGVTGAGTQNYLAKFSTNGTVIANSIIRDDGTTVSVDTSPAPLAKLLVQGDAHDMYVSKLFANTLNFGYNANAVLGTWVNYVGYHGATDWTRDFSVGNGQNAAIATFTGATKVTDLFGPLKLNGSSSGFATFAVPAAAGSPTFTFPTTNGAANKPLGSSDGAGTLAWLETLSLTGSVSAATGVTSTGGGIGYATGAGGTVTQLTSKATGVTLNKLCGTITMHNASLAGNTTVSFVLTNSFIAANDFVAVQHSSVGTLGTYGFAVTPAAGSATISVRNNSSGPLSEAIVLRFIVLKAVTA